MPTHTHHAELSNRVLVKSILCDMRTQCRECGDTDALRVLSAEELTLSDMKEIVAFRALIAHVCVDVRDAMTSAHMSSVYVDFVLGERLCDVAWSVRESRPVEHFGDVRPWHTTSSINRRVWDMWFRAWSTAVEVG